LRSQKEEYTRARITLHGEDQTYTHVHSSYCPHSAHATLGNSKTLTGSVLPQQPSLNRGLHHPTLVTKHFQKKLHMLVANMGFFGHFWSFSRTLPPTLDKTKPLGLSGTEFQQKCFYTYWLVFLRNTCSRC